MKRIILWSTIAGLLIVQGTARAGDEDIVWGALFGAGAGLILGEAVDGVHSSVAVPVGAIAGGLIGHELERTSRRHRRRNGYPHRSHYDRRYPYGHRRYGARAAPRRITRIVAPKPKKRKPPLPPPDYHPGIDVVKVEIRLTSGASMDVRLLRMPDNTFVGPQGETYTNLPAASELGRYAGKP